MLKVILHTTGKLREPWLQMALDEYSKRLTGEVTIETHLAKDETALEKTILKLDHVTLLDAKGTLMTSPEWSQFLYSEWEKRGSILTFAIGGANGFSSQVKGAFKMLSFSSMTFPHQIARLLFYEQTYRAIQIYKKGKYHK